MKNKNEYGIYVIPADKSDYKKIQKFILGKEGFYAEENERENYFLFGEEQDLYDGLERELSKLFQKYNINARMEGIFENTNINEVKLKPAVKKQIRGMFRINGKPFKQATDYYYYDKSTGKWWFTDFEGDLMELRNEYTLDLINKYVQINNIAINELNNKNMEENKNNEMSLWESIKESKLIKIKRKYTENFPAVTVGKHADIRNEVIKYIGNNNIIEEDEFENILTKKTNHPKTWKRRNKLMFEYVDGKIKLSQFGKRVYDSIKDTSADFNTLHAAIIYAVDKWKPNKQNPVNIIKQGDGTFNFAFGKNRKVGDVIGDETVGDTIVYVID